MEGASASTSRTGLGERLRATPGRAARRFDRLSDRTFAAVAFSPAALLVGAVVLPPIIAVFVLSVWRVEYLKPVSDRFVGTRNFRRIVDDEQFVASIPRTVVYAGLSTVLSVALALAVALLLRRGFRGSGLMTIAILLPWAIAPVVTGIYWRFIFNPSFGIATVFLDGLGLGGGTVSWLEGSRSAMVIAVVATAWRSAPLLAIILLAALRGIPRSLYRAARMDGAGGFASFRFVTLPALQNTLIIVTILQIVISLQVFDVIYSLTGGGPGGETTVITYYIWERAFQNLSFGYSAALAVFLFFVTLACALALILFRLRSGRGERERTA